MRKQLSFLRLVLLSVFSFIAALVLGCGGVRPESGNAITIHTVNASVAADSATQLHANPATVATITVLPTDQTLASDTAVQFAATAIYTDGTTQDITAQVTWTSSNTNTALISSSGLALTEIPGSTTITARSGSVIGTATISATLDPIVVTSIATTPGNQAVTAGGTEQYAATAN
jgi:hypothetical protein